MPMAISGLSRPLKTHPQSVDTLGLDTVMDGVLRFAIVPFKVGKLLVVASALRHGCFTDTTDGLLVEAR